MAAYIKIEGEQDHNKRFFSSIQGTSIFTCPNHKAQPRELEAAKDVANHLYDLATKGEIAPMFKSVQVIAKNGSVLYQPSSAAIAAPVVESEITNPRYLAWDGTVRIAPLEQIQSVAGGHKLELFFRTRQGERVSMDVIAKTKRDLLAKIFDSDALDRRLLEYVLTLPIVAASELPPPSKRQPTADELARVAPMTTQTYRQVPADEIVKRCVEDRLYYESFRKLLKGYEATGAKTSAFVDAAKVELGDREHITFLEELDTMRACARAITAQLAANEDAGKRRAEAERRLGGVHV